MINTPPKGGVLFFFDFVKIFYNKSVDKCRKMVYNIDSQREIPKTNKML